MFVVRVNAVTLRRPERLTKVPWHFYRAVTATGYCSATGLPHTQSGARGVEPETQRMFLAGRPVNCGRYRYTKEKEDPNQSIEKVFACAVDIRIKGFSPKQPPLTVISISPQTFNEFQDQNK